MPRELIAPARERVAFRDYERLPLAPNQIRVRSQCGAAKHGTEMAVYKGYGLPRGCYDGELGIFTGTAGDGETGDREYFPARLGNMCIGEVIEAGSAVTALQPGDRVFTHGGFRQEHVWPADRVRVPVVQPVVAFDDLLTEYPRIATAPEHNVKLGVRF